MKTNVRAAGRSAEESTQRLVVVSNRLPVALQRTPSGWKSERSSGGLATAMNPILQRSKGLWIGWPGTSEGRDDPKRQEIIARWASKDRLIAVDLPPQTAEHFYEGYANQTLWPLFHYFPSRIVFDPRGWSAYVKANELFRDAVVANYRQGDLIWVHDYQLMLLPELLREALPSATIGFFLHIPFPSSEVFRIIPEREELLEGLMGADFLAFHTHSHVQHFRSCLLRVLGRESRIDSVDIGGRVVRLEALPIGIAPEEFTATLEKRDAVEHMTELRKRYGGRKILLAVDRLDYTKGIPERLRTYARLLENAPHLRGQTVLIQVAVPSRERIFSYEALSRQVNELVGEINGQYGTPDWTPVVYIRRGISRSQLVALYKVADVGWITPLRDGMNLVSKEYVACKKEGDGVLILSEFAGAAEEMGEAFLVNPFDEAGTAVMLETALGLPAEEREMRIKALHSRVHRNNVFAWGERFLAVLKQAAEARAGGSSERPQPLEPANIVQAYAAARKRHLLLDYDGTLVPYTERPEQAVPPPELSDLLRTLSATPGNTVVLMSGRKRSDLVQWFGGIPELWLAAEHGALFCAGGSEEWDELRPNLPRDWMERVYPVLEHFVDRTPGSFIEEKEYTLVWHYRRSAARFAEWLAHELVAMLEQMLAETELHAIRGEKTVEIKPLWMHKGAFVERLVHEAGSADFQLALGDDRSDEDVFEALGEGAWTVHVGGGRSRARFYLPGPEQGIDLLRRLAQVART